MLILVSSSLSSSPSPLPFRARPFTGVFLVFAAVDLVVTVVVVALEREDEEEEALGLVLDLVVDELVAGEGLGFFLAGLVDSISCPSDFLCFQSRQFPCIKINPALQKYLLSWPGFYYPIQLLQDSFREMRLGCNLMR